MADSRRIKIKVISVGEPKPVGNQGAKVTQFKALEGNEEKIFECWSSALLEEIKPEAEIEVDVVHTINETSSGNYEHNKVTQVYKGGQPVKKSGGGFGGGYRGKTPEEIASIESQSAAYIAKDLVIAEKATPAIKTKLHSWVLEKMNGKSTLAKKAPSPAAKATVPDKAEQIENLFPEDIPGDKQPPKPQPTRQEREVEEAEVSKLNEVMSSHNITPSILGRYINSKLSWGIKSLQSLKHWQYLEILDAIKQGLLVKSEG